MQVLLPRLVFCGIFSLLQEAGLSGVDQGKLENRDRRYGRIPRMRGGKIRGLKVKLGIDLLYTS